MIHTYFYILLIELSFLLFIIVLIVFYFKLLNAFSVFMMFTFPSKWKLFWSEALSIVIWPNQSTSNYVSIFGFGFFYEFYNNLSICLSVLPIMPWFRIRRPCFVFRIVAVCEWNFSDVEICLNFGVVQLLLLNFWESTFTTRGLF